MSETTTQEEALGSTEAVLEELNGYLKGAGIRLPLWVTRLFQRCRDRIHEQQHKIQELEDVQAQVDEMLDEALPRFRALAEWVQKTTTSRPRKEKETAVLIHGGQKHWLKAAFTTASRLCPGCGILIEIEAPSGVTIQVDCRSCGKASWLRGGQRETFSQPGEGGTRGEGVKP